MAAKKSKALRILVADDSKVSRQLAINLLKDLHHEVEVAATGEQAVKAVQGQRFDLVLMDMQMPELDGIEATAKIREHEKTAGSHVPIVAVTGEWNQQDRERCLAAGMDDYISKPIEPKELVRVLKKLGGY